jgi:hypothetical protein
MQKIRRALFSTILLLAIVPSSPAYAASEHGPKLVSGAPVRHTLVSCATNTAEALTCIESIAVIEKLGDEPIIGKLTGRKIPSGDDSRIGDSERPVLAANGATEISVTPGNYEEWTFPKADGTSAKSGDVIVASEFQPHKATWCWSAVQCTSNREEYTVPLQSSRGPDTWKDNDDFVVVVTIRAPKTFEFGEVSGSAKNASVVYGKDLPDFKGVAMRQIIASFSPIATARGVQSGGGAPPERATFTTYNANLWIYGLNNDITQFLGPCAKLGGVQVVSNAMHSVDPVWDPATETIKVRLETPHLRPDGELNLGYLEVRIPRKSAICMWGFDLDGSIKASVSITYDDGSKPSVATVIGKRVENDYLIITSGFHFSSPNIGIKITQAAATPAPSPTPSASASPSPTPVTKVIVAKKIRSTISCVKGKTIRKVSGIKPICPKGFSLKS